MKKKKFIVISTVEEVAKPLNFILIPFTGFVVKAKSPLFPLLKADLPLAKNLAGSGGLGKMRQIGGQDIEQDIKIKRNHKKL